MMFTTLVAAAVAAVASVRALPIDDYVKKPDDSYAWSVNTTQRSPLGFTWHNVKLVSQRWLSPSDSNIYVWNHWLQVCVPDAYRGTEFGFMYINGGDNGHGPPSSLDQLAEFMCVESGLISATLLQIPNQPAVFKADAKQKRRTEDAVIAFTWRHFLDNPSKPDWLLRFPMVKAAVRAMDALTAFSKSDAKLTEVTKFVVAGASKRGWTTWLTAGVDKRVAGAIPIVMPIGNMVPNIIHHYRAYGGWSFAFKDYLDEQLMADLYTPQMRELAAQVDPYVFQPRLTMPKLVICSTGDEFFLPDSPQFWWNELPGPKLLNMVANAEHSLATALPDVASSIGAFSEMVVNGTVLPTMTWTLTKSNDTAVPATITVSSPGTSSMQPSSVQLWRATTLDTKRRDFRLVVCRQVPECVRGVLWWPGKVVSTELPGGGHNYTASVGMPDEGWTGFLVELIYTVSHNTLRVTSEVNILPDIMPFPPCTPTTCQNNSTLIV